ncbi:MAG: DUF2088 domain-containing protein, partial [Burkholderiaceae bacterium]|nr:DUF2088 domain-containing protein [Burkholderiaceae bacterium]
MPGSGFTDRYLTSDETRGIVAAGLASLALAGKRVLVIIPDGTRTMPMPQFFALFRELLGDSVAALDFLVALGTHAPMDEAALSRLVGAPVVDGLVGTSRVFNHAWSDPATFANIGVISAAEIAQLSGGRLAQPVPVALNRCIFDYDQIIICGPVFPHEVVGFSGGNKYLFPGIAGADVINFTHWLGALITSYEIIGAGYTPVRAVIDRAAAMVSVPTACFALVVTPAGLAGLYFGSARKAWEQAAALSAQRHILWLDAPVRQVLSVMPQMYTDIWTAGKGMYKIEPVVADGGEVIIYAPHISAVSFTHGRLIEEIGYHCRDYFLAQPERFADYPGGVL